MFKFIDAFAGIGGFHLAASKFKNLKCVAAIEKDIKCCEVYRSNFKISPLTDITTLDKMKLPDHDILLAGFPCQPFSRAGKHYRENGRTLTADDKRSNLFFSLLKILKVKKPKAFIFENVKGLLRINNINGTSYLNEMLRLLKRAGYTVKYKVLNSADFGLPQKRERVFFVGILGSNNFEFPKGTPPCVVLEDFININIKYEHLSIAELWKNWKVKDNLRIKPEMKKNFTIKEGKDRLLALKEVVENASVKIERKTTPLLLGKIEGDTPSGISRQADRLYSIKGIAPTLLTSTNTIFDMNSKNSDNWRALTSAEYAICQGFSKTFKFHKNERVSKKQLGNAVSINVVEALLRNLLKVI